MKTRSLLRPRAAAVLALVERALLGEVEAVHDFRVAARSLRAALRTLIERFQHAYAASLKWCETQPDACGTMVAKRIDMLTAEAVADSVRVDNTAFVTAQDARAELEFFFGQLHARQPGLIGGRLPDAGFYYSPKK